MTSSAVLVGGCQCGAVRYAVADEFRYAANCHCSNCRAATGSAFKAFAGIEREKLEITKGQDDLLADRRGGRERHALSPVRLLPLLRRAGRRVRARRDGVARRRSEHPPDGAHLRRLQGAVVRDHGRPAAVRRARGLAGVTTSSSAKRPSGSSSPSSGPRLRATRRRSPRPRARFASNVVARASTVIPAALPASIPAGASSITRQSPGIDGERGCAGEVRLRIRLASLDVIRGDQLLGDRQAAVRETARRERPRA